MKYSNTFRQLIDLVKHLQEIDYSNRFFTKSFTCKMRSTTINWDGYKLQIRRGRTEISNIICNLGNYGHGDNYISIHVKRMNLKFKSKDFKTFIHDELIIQTKDLCVDEGTYFQYNTLANLPPYEEICDIHDVAKELIENNMGYTGSYTIKPLDMKLFAENMEKQYPDSCGLWEKYK